MNFNDRNHFSRKSDPTYRNKKSKEVPVSGNMDSISNIKRKGTSLARPDLSRQNSLGISSRDSSKRISVLETSKSDASTSGGIKLMNFIKSSLNLTKSKSKSKLNISDGQQVFYNHTISSKSDDHLNVLADDSTYQFIKSNNLFFNFKDNTLYVKEYSDCNEETLKSLITLNNQCLVQPLHSSLTNHHNFCFQIIYKEPKLNIIKPFNSDICKSSQITKSISYNSSFCSLKSPPVDSEIVKTIRCSSATEVNEWITKIKKQINPNYENTIRHEDMLQIFIQEAKQLIPKKRYYCEIKLDDLLFGRTTIKTMADMVFWGEEFEFRGLQNITTVSICLYKMIDNKKKHEKSELSAKINIPCSEFTDCTFIEKWYSPTSEISQSNRFSQCKSFNSEKSNQFDFEEMMKSALDCAPMIRIKARYRPLEIFPTRFYAPLFDYLVHQCIPLVESLEPHLKVKSKEDLVKILLVILENKEFHIDFLADLVTMEVSKADDNLILRGNSIASKAMECYLKMVGEKYLVSLLKDLINEVIFKEIDCEVDPSRIFNCKESILISENQTKLVRLVENIWSKIFNSSHLVPNDLKSIFTKIREKLSETKRVSSYTSPMIDQVISSCLFLRFICPAIMSPFLFGLSNEYPDNVCINRTFTLIAKSIQSLANFSQNPQSKETYMEFMQLFINKNSSSMRSFLKQISTIKSSFNKSNETHDIIELLSHEGSINSSPRDDRYVDIGYHLAELMFHLNVHLKDIPEKEYTEALRDVRSVIENISKAAVHCESDTDSCSSNISNFNVSQSRIPTLISKTDKRSNSLNKSVLRVNSTNSNRPLSLIKQKSDVEENFSYIPNRSNEIKMSLEVKKPSLNNDNYVNFEHCENNIYDEPYQEQIVSKPINSTKILDEKEINNSWCKVLSECKTSGNYNNSILEDSNDCTLNSSGYQTLANFSPDMMENSIIHSASTFDYVNIESSANALASSLPIKLNSSKNSPIHQKIIYKKIKKNSSSNKNSFRTLNDLKSSDSNSNLPQILYSELPDVFTVSRETLESSENLSEMENNSIAINKSFQSIYQRKSGSNTNLISLSRERIISDSHESSDNSLSSKKKLKSRSSQSIQNIISTNIDLDPLISNEWKRIKLLLKLFNLPKPTVNQGSVIEQYKQRTLDENCLELFFKKDFQIDTYDIMTYLPAAYRLLKSVHKSGKLSTELLTKYLICANCRIQFVYTNQFEKNSETNGSKISISKKSKNSKAHRDLSKLSTQSLPYPSNKYSKQSQ